MHSTAVHCWVVQILKVLYTTQENLSEEHQESRYPTMYHVSSVKNDFFVCKKCSYFPGSTSSQSPVQKFGHTSPGLHVLFSVEGTFFLSWRVSNRTCGFMGQRIPVNFRDVWETAKTLSLWCGLMHRRAMTHYFLPRCLPVAQNIQIYWSSLFLLKWWSYINSHLPAGWYSL